MVEKISTLGLQLISASNLSGGQSLLSKLSQQLTTGKYSENLSDYSSSSAQKLLNFNSTINQQNGFLAVIDTLTPRLEIYNSALDGIEDTVSEASTTILSAATYDADDVAALQESIEGYMSDISYYLNQKVGDRYLFSGTRYDQEPVISGSDMAALPSPPTEVPPYLYTDPNVPAYDQQFGDGFTHAEAYVHDTVKIDTTKDLAYGVSSNDDGFQQVIMGLRWAYAATQDETNYEAYMDIARDLLSDGLSNVRATHTSVTNAYNTLNNTADTITTKISSLTDQVDNIENVDVNEVSVKITVLEAQLEASYAVTAKMVSLSILDYL